MLDRFKTKAPVKSDARPAKGQKPGQKQGLAARAQARVQQGQAQGRVGIVDRMKRFYRELTSELKKVSWPTRQQTINLTLVVIGLSLAVGIFLGGLDMVFSWLYSLTIR